MKRKLLPILILLLLAILVAGLFACSKVSESEVETPETAPATSEEKTRMLFLGDSIGEAIAGTTPLTERETYGYYGIIGNINGFEYYNRAVTGYTTEDLAALVKREDDGINMVRSLITTADIIHISIIGNDFLNSNHSQMLIDLADNKYDRIVTRQAAAKVYLKETLDRIRSLNPDVVILIQTLYNPADVDSPLFPTRARQVLASKGIGPDGYHALMGKMIDAINEILTDYLEEYTTVDEKGVAVAPFELIDVHAAFEEIYENDYDYWQTLFCEDGVHTVNGGHAITAEKLQEKLTELGYAAPNALYNYKRDKVRQLNRLYADLEDKETVRNNIMRAATFGDVSRAYFKGTAGVVPKYSEEIQRDGRHFDVTKHFEVTFLSVAGNTLTDFLDREKAEILFEKDGTYRLYLPFGNFGTSLVKYYAENGGIDAEDYFPFDLSLYYFPNIAPGVDRYDLAGVLQTITEYYGISIVGLDYDNPHLQSIFDRFRETGRLVIDDPDALGSTIGLLCTGTYVLENVTDAEGKVYTAIYVNNQVGRTESFIRYTYMKNEEEESEKVRMTIDVIRVELEGTLYEE